MVEILARQSRWLYAGVVLLVALERVSELRRSRRNQRWLGERGAIEAGAKHYPVMVLLHVLFLVSCPLEVLLLRRPFVPALAAVMLGLLMAAMALRYWVVATLGRRWTTRIFVLPGAPLVASGPFRFLRHPNYLAVAIEFLALPLIHGAWLTAALFSAANGLLLRVRIRVESETLRRFAANAVTGAEPAARGTGR